MLLWFLFSSIGSTTYFRDKIHHLLTELTALKRFSITSDYISLQGYGFVKRKQRLSSLFVAA
jgi:hypothetical protein